MKYGFVLPYGDARTVADLAHEAEAVGWDGFFVWEPVWGIDAWLFKPADAINVIPGDDNGTPLQRDEPAEDLLGFGELAGVGKQVGQLQIGLLAVGIELDAHGFCKTNLARYLPKRKEKTAIVAKGCDSRALVELIKENQIARDQLVIIGVPCEGLVDLEKLKAIGIPVAEVTGLEIEGGSVVVSLGQKQTTVRTAEALGALVLGLRDYVNKNGFPGVVLGLSGGIDSALCAAMAVDALGAERVRCVMLPYKFTSQESLKDAAACAKALGVRYEILPIAAAVEGFEAALAPTFSGLPRDVTEENLQARTRGTILMAISNKFNLMVVTTGNKSEMSVGYATLYGDMNGGFNPIKDLYKTEVFRLARLRNSWKPDGAKGPDGPVIPDNIITRPPTAELRENQKDEDSLPAYAVLDPILERLVEHEEPISAIVAAGFDRDTVMRVDRMINIAEYKRRQAAPGVKVTLKNFGRDRRYPITNRFRDPGTPMPAPDVSLITGKPIKSEAFDF